LLSWQVEVFVLDEFHLAARDDRFEQLEDVALLVRGRDKPIAVERPARR